MQGRLSPQYGSHIQQFPYKTWKSEFFKAAELGLSSIEWVIDSSPLVTARNPIFSDEKIETDILSTINDSGVDVSSVCIHFFVDYPLVRCENPTIFQRRSDFLEFAIRQAFKIGAKSVVLPFLDNSAILDENDLSNVIFSMNVAAKTYQNLGVKVLLETNLGPAETKDLIDKVDKDLVRINYDMGNSAALGHNCIDEILQYGDYIESVHVKDRIYDSGTVPLDTGSVDFVSTFDYLEQVGYEGPYILEAARGENGQEEEWTKDNIRFVKGFLEDD